MTDTPNQPASDDFPDRVSYGEKYGPAMAITDQQSADAYFKKLVRHAMRNGRDRASAEALERGNLGYYSGYYNSETMERVARLFGARHPVFGDAKDVTAEGAFRAGAEGASGGAKQP